MVTEKLLGNHSRTNLAGFLKIKLRASGLRVVYQLRRTEDGNAGDRYRCPC